MRRPSRGRARSIARALLVAGILLRAITWALMTPQNRDFHLGVITRFVDTGRLPIANETDQSYHPPLYYLITAPIFAVTHRPKVVQMFSLACAIATLMVFYRLLVETPLAGRMRDRLLCFALVAVNPQVITYGLYISNDTLAILLGAAVALQLWLWLHDPAPARVRWLGVLCGLGLLTKATFVAIVPVIAAAVAIVSWRRDRAAAVPRWLEFASIAVVLGAYKFIENYVHFGTPIVTNFDAGYSWMAEQMRGRTMPWAYIGFDWHRLLVAPTGDERRPYLELLYQTSWYEFLPMSNLVAARRWPFYLFASAAMITAVVPTLVAVAGACRTLVGLPRMPRTAAVWPAGAAVRIARATLIAMWLAVLALLVRQEFVMHLWPVMHARLLLPALAGAFAALRVGWDAVRRVSPRAFDRVMRASIAATTLLLLTQHLVDLASVPFRIAH